MKHSTGMWNEEGQHAQFDAEMCLAVHLEES